MWSSLESAVCGPMRCAPRPTDADEQWTFVVVTDHGHRDGGGHAGRSTWERAAWAATCGPGIVAGVQATHADIAPTVPAAAGVPIHSGDGFPGCSFQSR
ncbi:hypothetical protein [Allorhizocola rhizosphaerae]|uniref:hypothetical protein n=1 Tax=Allorhizocola rhizosphaerae TaxID=1872709 RepID=UPI001B8AE5D6|nr:hypothetical protein [Allorhizocola rhizosphaerae]